MPRVPRGSELAAIVAAQRERLGSEPKVAVIVRRPGHPSVQALRSGFPQLRIVELTMRGGLEELHLRLAAYGPFDLVVDLVRGPRRPIRRLSRLLLHTRPGGALVIRRPTPGRPTSGRDRKLAELLDVLTGTMRTGASGVSPPRGSAKGAGRARHGLETLTASVRDIEQWRRHVLVVNGVRALAVVPELRMNALLELRDESERVLDTVPGTAWDVRCTVDSNSTARLDRLPSRYDSPELSLREYDDVVCLPRQVAVTDSIVLPDSFRHNHRRRLDNRALTEWTSAFRRAPAEPAEVLSGTWFYLDSEYRGHFGHALTEQLSRSWGWAPTRDRHPSVRALVFLNKGRRIAEWEYELWAAAGIDRSDIVLVDEPVRVETLVGASPMFSMPGFVHPAIAHTYSEVGSALAVRADTGPRPQRIFVSRRTRKRMCRNAAEVESLFAGAGFTVVYPEDHRLADQVALFRRAEVIAGFAGSNMFHIAFTGGPKQVILIASEAYRAQNEYMMAAVLGHRLTYVESALDVPPEHGTRSRDQDYHFDLDAEGVYLRGVLDAL